MIRETGIFWSAQRLFSKLGFTNHMKRLVERILAMVKDPVRPIDIDQLLVVTFTRAAAGEMKERIGRALQQSLEENPENEHLQRQQTLLHHAQISTIHGFCSYVIKNYFQMIDLDPVYRMADEGEIRLMKSDVIQKVMEERFAEKDPAFTQFVESYAAGKQDDGLDALVLKLYEFSMSYPWPEQWLEECRAAYQIDSPEAVQKSIWVQVLMAEAKKRLSSILEGIEENRKTAVSPGGPYLYDEALASDQQMVEELIETESFDGMVRAMAGMKFKALSRKKADDVSEALKDQVKAERDACKKELQKLKEQFFEKDSAEIAEEIADCREPIGVLIDLTEQFAKAFAEKKRSKNILDYADLEHFALEILVQQEDGRLVRTDAARELSQCPARRKADGTGLWSAISSRASTDSAWRGRSCFWKNIIRMRRTGKASRESISTKTSEAGRRCLRRRIMYSAS